MKKTIGFIVILVAMVFALCWLKGSFSEYIMTVKDGSIKSQIMFKGLIGAADFTRDGEGNYYIAFKDHVQYIDKTGRAYNLFTDKKLSICSLEYNQGVLYYTSGTLVYSYNLKSKETSEIIKNLPNYGDYNKSLIRVSEGYLFVTIGSATNSGVVGLDNSWINDFPLNHDTSPKSITIKGINFGEEKTGAFVSYKSKNIKGQIITQHMPGNSSILIYNLKTGAQGTFAWGIRNIKGLDFSSQGKIIASVGGMEDRGLRPVKGDSDYIYAIKKNAWYGFPDYAGGDPISSPKFKGITNSTIPFILDQHPTTNPPAPIYQHESVDGLVGVSVDTQGILGENDCIYFYEKNDNSVYSFNSANALKEKINFAGDTYISSMKFFNKLILLDSKSGYLISMEKNNESVVGGWSQRSYYYLLVIVITLIGSILVWVIKRK